MKTGSLLRVFLILNLWKNSVGDNTLDISGYTFKALRSDDKDVLTVKYGETPIEVCIQGRRQQQHRVTMPLPGERRVHFGRNMVFLLL